MRATDLNFPRSTQKYYKRNEEEKKDENELAKVEYDTQNPWYLTDWKNVRSLDQKRRDMIYTYCSIQNSITKNPRMINIKLTDTSSFSYVTDRF